MNDDHRGPDPESLAAHPPPEQWDAWTEFDPAAWPRRVERSYTLVPTVCFNCESACGLLGWVDRESGEVVKFTGNPRHAGSRGRNCAKGPATINQVHDPDRILHPLKRVGERGAGEWERVSWEEVLDDLAARIRKAIEDGRRDEVMYHVGRPGEDHFTNRVLAAWGLDAHNSHTNICSSSARAGYYFWGGFDRPSPDHANARLILLVSAHLETGHYFNPHAQRIMEGREAGARLVVLDPRLSNTASVADHWLTPWPGSETVLLLAWARHLVVSDRADWDFVRRWVNWRETLEAVADGRLATGDAALDARVAHEGAADFDLFKPVLAALYDRYTFEHAARESGVDAERIAAVADLVAECGSRLCTHVWRSAASGNLGGWQVARCLWFLNVLTGSVGTEGGTSPGTWNKFVPGAFSAPDPHGDWNALSWPEEYPLSFYEMSFLLPHLLLEGRGRLDVYFTRVYNPVWINPDGFVWLEALRREDLVGCHVAMTPTWSETAWWADYVLPMGLGPERHDLMSQETHAGQWLALRQPVTRVAMERAGRPVERTRDANPGEVWEESEFWIELSWRIDPDGDLGIRRHFESPYRPGQRVTIDEYLRWIFDNEVPGLPEAAAAEGLSALQYMRRYGCFEVRRGAEVRTLHERPVAGGDGTEGALVRGADGRPAGITVDGKGRAGWPTVTRRLEFYQPLLAEWGWPEHAVPGHVETHVSPRAIGDDPDAFLLLPNFRLPTLIHTRSGNAKWLCELSHCNPTWMHPSDAERIGVADGDLVRVCTEIGHFVDRVWVTQGIRPGIVACSHHLGRWRLDERDGGNRWAAGLARIEQTGPGRYRLRYLKGVEPFESSDPDSARVWWSDPGVNQNLAHPVHPDPVSGTHCWHQRVRIGPAEPDDRHGDVCVDTSKSMAVFRRWLADARPPTGDLRRPLWLPRPLRPTEAAYRRR